MAFKFYYALRIALHKNRRLLRYLQIIRSWFILGPLRDLIVQYYQRRPPAQGLRSDERDLFPDLKVDCVVQSLNEKGYALEHNVPAELVAQIREYSEATGLVKHWNPHKECDAIDAIARNAKILAIARQYLGVEPTLWLTQLWWSFGRGIGRQGKHLSRHREPLLYDEDAFHYDALDFKSLTLFIYLTDVDASSGPHIVVEGTHAKKSFSDIRRSVVSDADIQQRFGDRVKVIVGEKGTMLFEETSSYHKASPCQTERLMLSIDYVLRRPCPPERPLALSTPE